MQRKDTDNVNYNWDIIRKISNSIRLSIDNPSEKSCEIFSVANSDAISEALLG